MTSQSHGSPPNGFGNHQIPETPAAARSLQRSSPDKLLPLDEARKKSLSRDTGVDDKCRLQNWPPGPKPKSSYVRPGSIGGTLPGQVEDSAGKARMDELSLSKMSVTKDVNWYPPATPFTPQAPSSATVNAQPNDPELSSTTRKAPNLAQLRGRVKTSKREALGYAKTINDLKVELQNAKNKTTKTKEGHRQVLESKDQALQEANSKIKLLESHYQRAMEAQEKELQQARTHLGLLKDESANAIQSKDLEIREAKDEVTTLKQQLEDRTQEDKVMELANMQNELRVLKKRLASSKQSTKFEPEFIHTNLFEAAPELLHENVFFDAEAKKEEIEKRPSRKQTFGKRLANVREKRGQYPHREVHRHSPKPHRSYGDAMAYHIDELTAADLPKRKGLQDLGPGEEPETNVLGEQVVEKGPQSFEELMSIPQNAIPCLVDNQLAYRDGTRVKNPSSLLLQPALTDWMDFTGCSGPTSAS